MGTKYRNFLAPMMSAGQGRGSSKSSDSDCYYQVSVMNTLRGGGASGRKPNGLHICICLYLCIIVDVRLHCRYIHAYF